jgi:hypothetical protein
MGQEYIEWVFDDAKSTIIQRGDERDQPDGERTIPRCVTAFNAITGHKLSNCDGWLFMEILKQCRSVQGAYKYDDYRDGVGYAALRAEEARMEHEATVVSALGAAQANTKEKLDQIRSDLRDAGMESADDVIRDLRSRGYGKGFVPPECDDRSTWTCQHGYTDCDHCIDGEYSPGASPDCDTRGGA